jgi:hypothetical protein
MPRSELDGLISRAQELGAKGSSGPSARATAGARRPRSSSARPSWPTSTALGAEEGTCCCWSPTSARSPTRSRADADRPGRALRADRRRARPTCSGSSTGR